MDGGLDLPRCSLLQISAAHAQGNIDAAPDAAQILRRNLRRLPSQARASFGAPGIDIALSMGAEICKEAAARQVQATVHDISRAQSISSNS